MRPKLILSITLSSLLITLVGFPAQAQRRIPKKTRCKCNITKMVQLTTSGTSILGDEMLRESNHLYKGKTTSLSLALKQKAKEPNSYKKTYLFKHEIAESLARYDKKPKKAFVEIQQQFGTGIWMQDFFVIYYQQFFQKSTPHLSMFFQKIAMLQNGKIEFQVLDRISYIAKNKDALARALLPRTHNLPISDRAFRLRYLDNIYLLTPENFNPKRLVLSLERGMSPNPQQDFAIRHISGRAYVKIGQQEYPVYNYNGPFENLPMLYRFLLNGNKPRKPLTLIWDKDEKAMALYNEDKTLWLRVTSHEYGTLTKLHIHLNEHLSINFVNTDGVESTEIVNLNLSIPLETPSDLPTYNVQDFLYKKMVLDVVKFFKGDDNVTVLEGSIF